jgi:type 2 lantibiotic biosynthesis protein LanM
VRNARFDVSLGCLTSSHLEELATQLSSAPGLSPGERETIFAAARTALIDSLNRRLGRVLILELNAARVENRLAGASPEERWDNFLEMSAGRPFWEGLAEHYPTLLPRVAQLCANSRASARSFGKRWAEDRDGLAPLVGGRAPGELRQLRFAAGDTHRGGQTVALLFCDAGGLVYKPRSIAPEALLASFIDDLAGDLGQTLAVRVPRVIDCGDYGWAEFIEHRHAADSGEMHRFYEAIGHWIAIMRLIAGTDFHAENLIAHGPSPVIVDAETLFAPSIAPLPQGLGDATDKALRLVSGTVLATGLLPRRGSTLGWRGIDMSGVGSIVGQQPTIMLPDIVGAGTDTAKFGVSAGELLAMKNHPAAEPSLLRHWPDVFEGFETLSAALRRLDADGRLAAKLERFRSCPVRVLVRPTEVYAEIGTMLWHPVSLHKESEARERARDLFARMAGNVAGSPSDLAVIDAEIDDLMVGDIPYFGTVASEGMLQGPGGTRWLERRDLVDGALQGWRKANLELERNFVRTTLVSAYVDDDMTALGSAMPIKPASEKNLDGRRRRQAAVAMRKLMSTAVRGDDGTVTWIAPTLTPGGIAVQVLGSDVYGGLSGIALAAGAYVHEQRQGRADPIDGAEDFLAGILKTLRVADEKHEKLMLEQLKMRPPTLSAYLGLGSHIWRHLALADWGLGDADGLDRAAVMAREIPAAAPYDEKLDLLTGRAGAIPPLLALSRKTGNTEFLSIAGALGDEICARAHRAGDRAFWVHEQWPEGMGGFAHGATGIGWSLFRLAEATGDAKHYDTAKAAFAFEDSLFDPVEQNWRDLRNLGGPTTGCAWCHGAIGIGLARLDLDPALANPDTRRSLRVAAKAAWLFGFGGSHCGCHGSVGIWELLDKAIAHREGPGGISRDQLLAALVASLEASGPSFGMFKEAFVPGLLLGMGGVVYQLLRAHPQSALPSFLTMEGLRGTRLPDNR